MNNSLNINNELINQNFRRIKYLSAVLAGVGALMIITDFTSFNPWDEDESYLFKLSDTVSAIIFILSALFCFTYKKKSLASKDFVAKLVSITLIAWAVVITALDFSTFGFSNYISALLLSIFFIQFKPHFLLLLIWISTITLFILLYIINGSDFSSTIFVLVILNAVTSVVSIKSYKEKIESIENNFKKDELNKKIAIAKDSLDLEVKKQTESLLISNKELLINKKQLSAERDRFKALISNIQSGVFYINTQGEILEANALLLEILGLSSIEAAKTIDIFNFDPLNTFGYSDRLKQCIKTSEIVNGQGEYKAKSDNLIYVKYYFVPIFEEGSIIGVLGNIEDVTEKNKKDRELKKAKEKAEESDRLKTEFINNMSHEIRTPMNGILGFSKLLGKPNKSEEKRTNYINIIQNSGNQLMRIIDDILEISKLGTKQVKVLENVICLNDLLLELFSIFDIKAKENKTPLYLKKGLSDNESTILTDYIKLNKILSNLLDNALKFTNVGFIEFGYRLINNDLEIYVKDTGIGIKHESKEIIFERFSQEEKELSKNVGGLGLGLSIAKENAELLGGTVTLKSEKGKGATFFVTIPYQPVNVDKTLDTIGKKQQEQDKYTILIVEDEEVNYLFIETLLEDEIGINCNILHAKHGKEAVEMCKENQEISFVLMDLKMPIMNGFEATTLIKGFRPNLLVVAQTAYSTEKEKAQAYSAGCDDFISKPIKEETLNEIINKYLTIR